MEMLNPTPEHERMKALEGAWIGADVLHPSPWDPKGGKATSRFHARRILGGFHLVINWTQERGGAVNFEGHGVLGWDPRGKCYTLHWFDSMGAEHGAPAIGEWVGDALTLTHETSHMGSSRQRYEIGEDEIGFRLEHSADGSEWRVFLESRFKREQPAP